MVKKTLYLLTMIAISGIFASCQKSNNAEYIPNDSNQKILSIMEKNYCWNLPDPRPNPAVSYTDVFFKSLLSPSDSYVFTNSSGVTENRVYSWIRKVSELSASSVALDAGFEYAVNQYQDGKVHYIILYVKKGSAAEKANLKRGYIITAVDQVTVQDPERMTKVAKDNWDKLLPGYIQSGSVFNILVRAPQSSNEVIFQVQGQAPVEQNPLYVSKIIQQDGGARKIGYLVVNHFSNGDKYAEAIGNKLKEFESSNVNNLILDLRYNGIGGYAKYFETLGTALVKSQDKGSNVFTYLASENTGKNEQNTVLAKFSNTSASLGDKLNKIYVITGKNTAGYALSFIHSLRAYWGDNLIVTGEDAPNYMLYNVAMSQILYDADTPAASTWAYQIPLGYLADKNKNHAYRTKVNYEFTEINEKVGTTESLKELGDADEYVLSETLKVISGSSRSFRSTSSNTVKVLGSSFKAQPEGIDLNVLK